MRGPSWVLIPNKTWFSFLSDVALFIALIYTVVAAPFEMAFLPSTEVGAVFVVDRCCDIVFLQHMCLSFFLSHEKTIKFSQRVVWETSLKEVALRYATTYFFLDLAAFVSSILDIISVCTDDYKRSQKAFRLLWLLRLFKMVKFMGLLHNPRILRQCDRWCKTWKVPAWLIRFLRGLTGLCVFAHLMACCWGLTGLLSEEGYFNDGNTMSWLKLMEQTKGTPLPRSEPFLLYLVSLYWAIVTTTTCGYGDILPVNTAEYFVANFLILAGACAWTTFFGAIIAAVNQEDKNQEALDNKLRRLQGVIETFNVSDALQDRMRAHLMGEPEDVTDGLVTLDAAAEIMSPSIRDDLLLEVLGPKLQAVNPFSCARRPQLRFLVQQLRISCFQAGDWILSPDLLPFMEVQNVFSATGSKAVPGKHPRSRLWRMEQGVMVVPKALPLSILHTGSTILMFKVDPPHWHHDFLVARPLLQNPIVARAMAHSAVHMLSRDDVMRAITESGDLKLASEIRKAAALMAMRRLFKLAVTRQTHVDPESGTMGNLLTQLGQDHPQSLDGNVPLEGDVGKTTAGASKSMDRRMGALERQMQDLTRLLTSTLQKMEKLQTQLTVSSKSMVEV